MRRARHLKTKAPHEYAKGAIAELRRQLETAQTDSKKARLNQRITYWEVKLTEAA